MTYRELGERPDHRPPPRPIEWHRVLRYPPWGLALILAGFVVVGGFLGWIGIRETSIVCVREPASEVPRCDVTERAPGTTTFTFALTTTSMKIEVREINDSKRPVLVTPNGVMYAAVDQEFADATMAGARAYLAGNAPRWEAHRVNDNAPFYYGALGAALSVLMYFVLRGRQVGIDRDKGVLLAKGTEHSLSSIKSLDIESIDDSEFHALYLVSKSDERTAIADGREKDLMAAKRAINSALRELEKEAEEREGN